MSPSYFLFIYSVVNYLLEKGYNQVLPYNVAQDGGICIQEDQYIYYVVDWIESTECRFKNTDDLKQAIKTAAELHQASIGYKPPINAKPRRYYSLWVNKFKKKCIDLLTFRQLLENKLYKSEFDEQFEKDLLFYWEQGNKSIDALNNSDYDVISKQSEANAEFCHHDMANHNFIITPDKSMYLIDFDYCIMDTRLHDVCSLIIRNMRYGVWDIEKAYFILNEYSRWFPISNSELKVMKAFMLFPQDYWQVGLQYYIEKQPWTPDYFLTRLNRIIDDKEKRQIFLDAFLGF